MNYLELYNLNESSKNYALKTNDPIKKKYEQKIALGQVAQLSNEKNKKTFNNNRARRLSRVANKSAISGTTTALATVKYREYKKLAKQAKNENERKKYEAMAKKYKHLALGAGAITAARASTEYAPYIDAKRINNRAIRQAKIAKTKLTEGFLEGYYDALEEIEYLKY
jgi:hypothetical protein